jgi:phosphoserine phosphatase RsbU/P
MDMTEDLDRIRIASIVRALPVFGCVSEEAAIVLIDSGQLVAFDEGQLLIKQGQPSDFGLLVVEGEVDVFVESKYGVVHLASLHAPALVGEIGVFTNVSRTASIKSKTRVQAVKLEGAELQRFGQENPSFLSTMMLQLGRRFETFNKAMGFYSHALGALERDDFDLTLLDDLRNPLPELVDFSRSFVRLAEQITLRRAHREEMANARAIQESMLPPHDLLKDCNRYVDVHAAMRPAREVGGDLYDFFLIDSDRLAITVGDVCGKGIPAALFMAMTQMVMRYMLRREPEVGSAATAGNALLAASNRELMFATLFAAVLDLRTGVLSYCNCGHHSPLILRSDDMVEEISTFNLPLGVEAKAKYKTDSLILEPGDRLLLFTDGFIDALNGEEERFGDDRLHDMVRKLRSEPAANLVHSLMKSVDDFVGDAPQFDDLTALAATLIAKKSARDVERAASGSTVSVPIAS